MTDPTSTSSTGRGGRLTFRRAYALFLALVGVPVLALYFLLRATVGLPSWAWIVAVAVTSLTWSFGFAPRVYRSSGGA